jgi:hypothetical protein
MKRRAKLAGLWVKAKQPPARFDLACFRQLHADHAAIAPCDAASADHRVKYAVHAPRHHATKPLGNDSIIKNARTWKIRNGLRPGGESGKALGGPRGLG